MPISYKESIKNQQLDVCIANHKKKPGKSNKCYVCGAIHIRSSKYCSKACCWHDKLNFKKR